jgi:hypothetical protein
MINFTITRWECPIPKKHPFEGLTPIKFLVQSAAKPSRLTPKWRDTETQSTMKQKDMNYNLKTE